jgi:hypothetical protein
LGHEISNLESEKNSKNENENIDMYAMSKYVKENVLWWDVECPVLNGRIRHVFKEHSDFDASINDGVIAGSDRGDGGPISENNDHNYNNDNDYNDNNSNNNDSINFKTHNHENIYSTPGKSDGITFTIINSNSDGSVPLFKDRVVLGTAHLSHQKIQEIMSSNDNILSLPLVLSTSIMDNGNSLNVSNNSENFGPKSGSGPLNGPGSGPFSEPSVEPTYFLTLNVSHRFQPVLYRSVDLTNQHNNATNTDNDNDNINNDKNTTKASIDILKKYANKKIQKFENGKIHKNTATNIDRNEKNIESLSLYEQILKGVHTRTYIEKYGDYVKEKKIEKLFVDNDNKIENLIDTGIMIVCSHECAYLLNI